MFCYWRWRNKSQRREKQSQWRYKANSNWFMGFFHRLFPIFTHRASVILYTILKLIKINEWLFDWFPFPERKMVDNHKWWLLVISIKYIKRESTLRKYNRWMSKNNIAWMARRDSLQVPSYIIKMCARKEKAQKVYDEE